MLSSVVVPIASRAPTTPGTIDYMVPLVLALPLQALSCSWHSAVKDAERLDLIDSHGMRLGAVWPAGGGWSASSGTIHDSKEGAVLAVEEALRSRILTELAGFQDLCLKILDGDYSRQYSMCLPTRSALDHILTHVMNKRLEVALGKRPQLERGAGPIFDHSFFCVEYEGNIGRIFKPAVISTYRHSECLVRPGEIYIWSSTMRRAPGTFEQLADFGNGGRLESKLLTLSETGLSHTIDSMVEAVFQFIAPPGAKATVSC